LTTFDKQLKPIRGFLQFLEGALSLADEFRIGSGTHAFSVVSTDRSSAFQQLPADDLRHETARQRGVQPDNSQSELLGASLQVDRSVVCFILYPSSFPFHLPKAHPRPKLYMDQRPHSLK
jgi:hypothetical protein